MTGTRRAGEMSRRRVCAALTGAGLLACSREPLADDRATPIEPPIPDLVLHGDARQITRRRTLTIYGDGRATWSELDHAWRATPVVRRRGRVGEAQRAELRELLASPAYLAHTTRARRSLRDEFTWSILGGPGPQQERDLQDLPELPDDLRALLRLIQAIEAAIREGEPGFAASDGGLLLRDERRFHARPFFDELTIYSDGLADYRRPHAQPPEQIVHLTRLSPPALEALRAALATAKPRPTERDRGVDLSSEPGTTRALELDAAGPISLPAREPPPRDLLPLLAALAPVYAQLGAPPDELTRPR